MELTTITVDQSDDHQVDRQEQLLDIVHYVDNFLYVGHITFAVVGVLFNSVLIGTVVFVKKLHLPRNFNWIGIGISNICLIVSVVVLDVSVRWKSSSRTRFLCSWLVDLLSIATQTVNFVISQVERHVLLTYPRWHLSHVSVGWIVSIQLSWSISIFLVGNITNFPVFEEFFSQYFSSLNFNVIVSLLAGPLPILLMGQISIMRSKTQKHYPSVEVVHMKSRGRPGQQNISQQHRYFRKKHFVIIKNQRVNILDFEAAKHYNFMAKVYILSMIPGIIFFIFVSICPQISLSDGGESCSFFIRLFYYSSLSQCIHSSIANPIIFVYFAGNLVSVWKTIWNQLQITAIRLLRR